jgi:2',3'-cyclic-nucleotide 2'-phosphodiesterase (5'-nucleotidase family)
VVAIAHTPLEVDMIIARSAGVDVIIGGHDEHLLAFYDGKVTLTESESQANYITVTELAVTKATKDGKTTVTWVPNFRIVDSASVKPDPEIEAVVKGYEDKLSKELDIEVGVTETPLDSRRATVRGGEAAMGNLIADALKASVGADVAITNGGGIRADKQYEAGHKLTRRDILAEMPFGNTTVLLEVKGEHIKAALENGVSQVRELGGRFPQVSGITADVDLKEPVGSRVKSVKINGEPLDPAKTYKLATNDFMARGGDGYKAFTEGKSLIDVSASQLMASQVIDYVAKVGKVAPKVEGRIVLR